MDGDVAPLQVSVGGRNVGVSGLIAGDDYSGGVGQIAYAGILERIELVAIGPSEGVAEFPPDTGKEILVGKFCRWAEI